MPDALVIGGGPAGCACAIGLARRGWQVVLVEKAAFPRRKVCGEFLSAASIGVLDGLGVGERWRALAGPEVRSLALFAGERVVTAPMPDEAGHGRALGRDVLDGLLLDEARRCGVTVRQPVRVRGLRREAGGHVAELDDGTTLSAPLVVAAHGSWERGPLPTHLPPRKEGADLLGFKAHFRGGDLSPGTMPLLAFRGGYGGMVMADDGRLSVSCCIRRDVLAGLRRPGEAAGDSVGRHLAGSCRGVREALAGAERLGPWLGAGPIRPGIRIGAEDDILRAGNLAGEAHPVIADGISMALQSGWLLAEAMGGIDPADEAARRRATHAYAQAWRRQFRSRIHAANVFSRLATRTELHRALTPVFARLPVLLTQGARLSGKSRTVGSLAAS